MTQTQTDSSRRYTRRGVIRRTALGVGAAAGLGGVASTSAAAISLPSRETVLTAAGVAVSPPAVASYYLYKRVTDPGTGGDVDDELADLNATETHTSVRSDLIEMGSVDDRVLTLIDNIANGLDRTAYQKGIEVAIERMDLGDTQTEVENKAVDAAMTKIETSQKNLIDHYEIQISKIVRLVNEIEATSSLTVPTVMTMKGRNGTGSSDYYPQATNSKTFTLAGGTGYTSKSLDIYFNSNTVTLSIADDPDNTSGDSGFLHSEPVDTGSQEPSTNLYALHDLYAEIQSIASTVETEILNWIGTVYPNYSAGDVNLDELVTADQLAATASEQNDLTNVTADFASLGIPINDRTTLTVEIVAGENSGTVIDGNLSVQNPPTDGFVVGDTYDPSNISGPVFLMYDRTTDSGETEGDVYQLQNKFKVIDAEGYDEEPVSNVTFEDKTTSRYSTDIQELNNQLDKLAQYQQEIQEERDALIEEEATGGGGGFLSDFGQGYSTGVLALGAAGVAWLLSKN